MLGRAGARRTRRDRGRSPGTGTALATSSGRRTRHCRLRPLRPVGARRPAARLQAAARRGARLLPGQVRRLGALALPGHLGRVERCRLLLRGEGHDPGAAADARSGRRADAERARPAGAHEAARGDPPVLPAEAPALARAGGARDLRRAARPGGRARGLRRRRRSRRAALGAHRRARDRAPDRRRELPEPPRRRLLPPRPRHAGDGRRGRRVAEGAHRLLPAPDPRGAVASPGRAGADPRGASSRTGAASATRRPPLTSRCS